MIKDRVKTKKAKKVSEGEEPRRVLSTRERMMQRKRDFENRGKSSGILFPKEGTMRVRLVSQGPDEELGMEVIQFYLGQSIGSIISPATFDEPCPFMEKYQELKNSDDPDDQELAGKLVPKRRYIIGGTVYKDEKGKEVDTDKICKPIQIPQSVYQDIIDLYLDEDDWGDMTDPEDGYDIKISRSGSGKNDTTYSVTACPKRGKINPKYIKQINLEEIIRNQMKSYDELEDILAKFLNEDFDSEEDTSPSSSKKEKKKVKTKKVKKVKK